MLFKVATASKPGSMFTADYLRVLVDESDTYARARRGRPNKTWFQCVIEDLGRHSYGLFSGMALARNHPLKFKKLFLDG